MGKDTLEALPQMSQRFHAGWLRAAQAADHVRDEAMHAAAVVLGCHCEACMEYRKAAGNGYLNGEPPKVRVAQDKVIRKARHLAEHPANQVEAPLRGRKPAYNRRPASWGTQSTPD